MNSKGTQYIIEPMKRHALALLIHPYKNSLLKKDEMRKLLDTFAKKLLDIVTAHPNLRLNLTLPGYMLHLLDPLLLSKLNDIQKSDCLEWLTPGYTEPFLSFSPLWLSGENIKYGIEAFNELVGSKPTGHVPAFSNWEPSSINTLRDNGINYTVLSRALLPKDVQNYCGYWITEHTGYSMVIVPAYNIHYYNAPPNILNWIDMAVKESPNTSSTKLIAIDYLVPLVTKNTDPFKWLNSFAEALDKLLITYQISLLHEFSILAPPLGLQYIPSSLVLKHEDEESISLVSNYLHTFDSVGIMQRKMMDIAENVRTHDNNKEAVPLKKQLFSAQDINRYIPDTSSGFTNIKDRFWTFGQMIEIEKEILKKDNITGGQIRIADLLKNGIKSIVMSNKNLKVYIDHKNGGQVFEFDYRERSANLFAGYNPKCHMPPRIIVAGKSRTSFIDHFLEEGCQREHFMRNTAKQHGDFVTGQFDYKVKKTASGVKAILTRQGSITIKDKLCPLSMEKVFGLEKDKPELTFVYQLSNHSLSTYTFKFAVELTFSLPGVQSNQAEITCDNITYNRLAWDRISFKNASRWNLSDRKIGTEIQFITQKPVTVWCYPVVQSSPYQGTTLVISTSVSLEENSVWSLIGKITCKKLPLKGTLTDVV